MRLSATERLPGRSFLASGYKSPILIALSWGINNGRTVIPKSVIGWQIRENLEAGFGSDAEDMANIATMDIKARFNDPSECHRWNLYEGKDGK
jgi:diketogulonate reductase-like aldo/keto reductase